jgi:hypothetical protein
MSHHRISGPLPAALAVACLCLLLPAHAEEEPAAAEEVVVEDAEPAQGSAEAAEEMTDEESDSGRDWISGNLRLELDAIHGHRASDVDFDQTLRMRIEPPKHPRLRFVTSFWLTEDLDGDEDPDVGLYDIDSGYGSDIQTRLLSLYLEADDVLGGATLRLGRQRILDGPLYNRIDGLHLKWVKNRWTTYLYGGARASLYEDAHNDLVLGVGADYRVGNNTRVGIDLFYGDEHRDGEDRVRRGLYARLLGLDFPREVETEIDDRLIAFRLYQRFFENHWLYAEFLVQNERADELTLDLTGFFEATDITYHLSYRRRLARAEDRVNALTSFYRVLGAQEKYHQIHASVQRPFTERFTLALEADWHDSDDDSPYTGNRDYIRLALVASVTNIYKGVNLETALERWDVDGGEDAWVITGEVNRKWDKWEVALGADYEQYQDRFVDYNPWPYWIRQSANLLIPGIYTGFSPAVYFLDDRVVQTREEIYSVYSRVRWEFAENQALSFRVRYEQDDGPDAPYWRLRAAYELDF